VRPAARKTLAVAAGLTLATMLLGTGRARELGSPTAGVIAGGRADARLTGLPPGPGSVPGGGALDRLRSEDALFEAGLALFDKDFHVADGLGAPDMNGDSCRACHRDPSIGGAGGLELNVSRFGGESGGSFVNLPGGQGLSKLRPPQVPGREEYDPTTASVFEQRQTPTLFGAGLIDGIPEPAILAGEDPFDLDGNGVFGTARMVDVGAGVLEVGRFGWKAQAPRLMDFLNDAMGNEMGITCPDDGRGFALLVDGDGVPDPELSAEEGAALLHFLSNLPAPQRTGSHEPSVLRGEEMFASVGCALCHVPSLPGATGPVPLYSDLLLHDVMPAGFRGMAEPGAGVGVYRTPPLWGVGSTAPYLHDGRAATLAEAVLAHDGEAAGVVARYQALPVSDRRALVAFLQDL